MLKKQIITTEEFNSTGDLSRSIVEENEFVEDTPLQVPYPIPTAPGDTAPARPWWQDPTCACAEINSLRSDCASVTSGNNMEAQNGKN